MMPKISIIMPVYNTGKYLDESIPSILAQTFNSFELICVDDCSNDRETKKKLTKYAKEDARISVVEMNQNSGAAMARNSGLEKAVGKYVQFLDADDVFAETLLEEMYNVIEKKDADVCVCSHQIFYGKGKKAGEISHPKEVQGITDRTFSMKDAGEDGLCWWWDVPWNKLVRKAFLDKNKIRFQPLESFNDGYFANMSVLLAEKIVYTQTKRPLVFYRLGDANQISADADILNFYYFIKKLIDDYWKYAEMREKRQILCLFSECGINWLGCSKNLVRNEQLYNLIQGELKRITDHELIYSMSERVRSHINHFIEKAFDPRWNG